jgi:hypothetical protein
VPAADIRPNGLCARSAKSRHEQLQQSNVSL